MALLNGLPDVAWLLADCGYDADWFREALSDWGTKPCIPGRKSRKRLVRYNKRRYRRRNRIERMFGRLKDWQRLPTRYDPCPKVLLAAIALAAIVRFWLGGLSLRNLVMSRLKHFAAAAVLALGPTNPAVAQDGSFAISVIVGPTVEVPDPRVG